MEIKLGEKIKELRNRDGRTQENLADALGVTNQAVSRWEKNGSYPDLELIPSIANYFGITIDELFGYRNDRENKIDAIIKKIDAFHIKGDSSDGWIDECLAILREGLAEFPQNERLLITLADTLSEAGWRRHSEWTYYDDEGFIQHSHDIHKSNEYWQESIKICEYLAENAADVATVTKAIHILTLLYRNVGENEKAIAYAQKMPELKNCRELLLSSASDGKEHTFTSSLVSFVKYKTIFSENIAKTLPNDWPFWYNPDYSKTEKEIKADPRWKEWVDKTQS